MYYSIEVKKSDGSRSGGQMKKIFNNRAVQACIVALIVVLLVIAGALTRLDRWMQDVLFERPQVTSGDIVVIGIDEDALNRIGPYQTWDRNVIASALDALAADPENQPAVVAIDTLYSGETDPEADQHLADAAEKLGCVVTATGATFDSQIAESANGYYMDDFAILAYDEPYDALKDVTTQGHVNAMYDSDGIMRHAMLYLEPDGEKVYSIGYQAAKLYAEKQGLEITEPPTDSRGMFYVSYTAGPGGYYDHVSVADLIDGTVPSDYYAGKIVLIGPYATGLQDACFTPIARNEQMYGVEVHANVIDAILKNDYKTEVPDLLQLILLFAITWIITFICLRTKVLLSVIITAAAAVGSLLICVALYNAGYLMHPLWIPVGVIAGCLVSIVAHYIRSAMEKREITRTFERYVAPEIVEEILKEGTENIGLGGKSCEIAVLFVDVRGFTTMSERLDPEKVVYILNKYLTMASGCVERNHGTLDKFVGDAMMAFWGAPLPQEDGVYHAVRTAMEIIEGAHGVSEELKSEIGEELNVGVGVNYGPAVVGNMGSERHMDYTAIGDTVNTAARLEANAPGGTVYISRSVADQLGDRVTVTSLGGTIKLKGKAEGFEVLKVENLK